MPTPGNPAGIPPADPLTGAEFVHVVQGGNSRAATTQEIAGVGRLRLITLQVLGQVPIANEILALYPSIDAFTFPINFAGSKSSVAVNPAAPFTITVARQVAGAGAFATIGTIAIAIDGTVTWATTGGVAIAIAAGDVIKATGDADGDTAFLGAFTIKGQL